MLAGKSAELPLSISNFCKTTVVDANGVHFAETDTSSEAELIVYCVNAHDKLAANQPED